MAIDNTSFFNSQFSINNKEDRKTRLKSFGFSTLDNRQEDYDLEDWQEICRCCDKSLFEKNPCATCAVYDFIRGVPKNNRIEQLSNLSTNQGGSISETQNHSKINILEQHDVNQNNVSENVSEGIDQSNGFSENNVPTLDTFVNQNNGFEHGNGRKEAKKINDSIDVNRPLTHRLTTGGNESGETNFITPKNEIPLNLYWVAEQLSDTDIRILKLLNAGFPQTKIAKILRITRQAVSKRVRKFEEWGVVTKIGSTKPATYKVNPKIFEIINSNVNQVSRGIDRRVEWGYFRIHGYQRRFSLSTGSLDLLLSCQDRLQRVRGFVKIGNRPGWKFIVFERDGFKFEIRPKSIGVSVGDGNEYYYIPFKAYKWRALKDRLRHEIDEKTLSLIEDIERETGVRLTISPDGWSHDIEVAFLDSDGVIRKVWEEHGCIVIEGIGRIDTSTGEPELEFDEENAGERAETFKEALESIGKFAKGQLPEPLKESIKDAVVEATILGGSRTIQHQINELYTIVTRQKEKEIQELRELVHTLVTSMSQFILQINNSNNANQS